ncbi:MAG: hypothetical protein ACSLE6_07400 [Mycobacterium sp.]
MFWAAILVSVAAIFLFAIPLWGALKFNPDRARTVKYVELSAAATDRVVQVRLLHPEIVQMSRMDRHPFYVLVHFGVIAYAVCVYAGSPLTSNVIALAPQTRYTMAGCFIVGSMLAMIGSLLGAHVGRWTFGKNVREHLTAPVLGDDVGLPYRVAIAGLSATMVSFAIYSETSFQSTAGSLGGWLTGSLAAACILTIVMLYRSMRTFEKWDSVLISEAKARLDGQEQP